MLNSLVIEVQTIGLPNNMVTAMAIDLVDLRDLGPPGPTKANSQPLTKVSNHS